LLFIDERGSKLGCTEAVVTAKLVYQVDHLCRLLVEMLLSFEMGSDVEDAGISSEGFPKEESNELLFSTWRILVVFGTGCMAVETAVVQVVFFQRDNHEFIFATSLKELLPSAEAGYDVLKVTVTTCAVPGRWR